MKLITFTIPCYNSQDYMEKCINSLLPGGDEVEIIIVDDGSSDGTADIADLYEKNHPGIVRAIHQENGGHGAAVNTGMENAKGLYFKVVDSDDWVDEAAYESILAKLREFSDNRQSIDMFISNYVYEKEGASHKKVMQYPSLPKDRIFNWSEAAGRLHKGQYILMHSVIYRTELLRKCGLKLPEHTFYVDNIYVYKPLPSVKNIYYMDVDFYRYYIGREDQSVNEKVMISRIDQQIKVNKIMVDEFDLWEIEDRTLRRYMYNYLEIITVISSVMLIRSGTEENLQKKRELWRYIRQKDLRLSYRLRSGVMGNTMNLPGKGGRKISVAVYKLSQKVVGFN